jgi:tetratricopeptide (TPR) repeat protein
MGPLLLLLTGGTLTLAPQITLEPAVVRLEHVDGADLWTVRAGECSPALLVRRLSELAELEIDSTPALQRAPAISVSLTRRPLEMVLEYALGAAGLRAELDRRTIVVRQDRREGGTIDERLVRASAAWARAAERFPHHPTAAGARLALGELEELSGRGESARSHYLDVLSESSGSSATPEAYLRAGRLAARRGDWSEASEHFRTLANLDGAEEYVSVARLELARATLRLGDPASALTILDRLDELRPAWDSFEASARALVRIEALLESGACAEALLEIDSGHQRFDEVGTRAVARMRALALEGAGFPEEASRAWLVVARDRSGPERLSAYRTAARLCADVNDPMGVLFVAREARSAGFGGAVAAYETAAREHLGLVPPGPERVPGLEDRLSTAELWLAHDLVERAAVEFEALHRDRAILGLDVEQTARVVLGHARALRATGQLQEAIEVVRSERVAAASAEYRRALDTGMATFFEEAGLFERAADAYTGNY